MNSPLLSVDNLSVSFADDAPVLKSVSFEVPEGRTLGVIGESGGGKSMAAYAVIRLLPENARATGRILFRSTDDTEIDLNTLSEKQMQAVRGKQIAMIFQEPMTALNPVFTCGAQVIETILYRNKISKKDAIDRARALFEEVRLPRPTQLLKAYPHELSGGQRQRVLIAMAIANRPKLLIADEPTSALDATVQKSLLELLAELKSRYKMSMIFITHDLGVLEKIADEALVLKNGEIIEKGEIKSLTQAARHPYTRGLLACRPPISFRVRRLPTLADYADLPPGADLFQNTRISSVEYETRQTALGSAPVLLKVEGLKKYYPIRAGFWTRAKEFVRAVDDVHFEIREGETLGLLGESGSGKTTVGRAILRLIEPDAGKIDFDGQNWGEMKQKDLRALRKNFQIIFQDPYSSLDPRQSVGDAILEPMRVHGLYYGLKNQKEKVMELLERVGLKPEYYGRKPNAFSGGQRQRICIARALALNPKLIVCDEVVSALDVFAQAQIINLLLQLREDYKISYLFISHDVRVVKLMSDTIMVMQAGRVVEKAEAETLIQRPQNLYTRELLAAAQ